jgi:hypothetical protein
VALTRKEFQTDPLPAKITLHNPSTIPYNPSTIPHNPSTFSHNPDWCGGTCGFLENEKTLGAVWK